MERQIPIADLEIQLSQLKLQLQQTKRELDEQKDKLNQFQYSLDNLNEGILISKINENGLASNFIEVNEAACQQLGLTKKELLNLSICDVNRNSYSTVDKFVNKIVKHKHLIFEIRRNLKNRGIRDFEINSHVFHQNGDQIILSVIRDITFRKKAELALRKSEERYRVLFNSGNDAVFVHEVSPDGIPGYFIEVNEVACKRLGYTQEELLQMSSLDIEAPETLYMIPEIIKDLLKDKYGIWEGIHVRKDGHYIPVEISTHVFEVDNKQLFISTARDISEHKVTDKELKESQKKYRTIFEQSPIAIEFYDVKGLLMNVNQACLDMFEIHDADSLKGLCLFDDPNLSNIDRKSLKNGKPVHIESEFCFDDARKYKLYANTKPEPVILDMIIVPLLSEDNDHYGYVAQVQNITSRKKIENELHKSKALLERAQDIAKLGYWEINLSTGKIWTSPQARQIYGLDSQYDTTIQDIKRISLPEYRRELDKMMVGLIKKNKKYDTEFKIRSLDKNEIVDIHSIAEYDPLEKKVFGIIQNISDRTKTEAVLRENENRLKQQNEEYLALNEELVESNDRILKMNDELVIAKEKAEESDRLKTAFLANLSHEIRTPMNGIIGFSELLTKVGLDENTRVKYSETVKQSCHRLLGIISDIIDIAKIETGQVKVSQNKVNVNNFMKDCYVFYKPLVSKKNIDFQLHIELPDPQTIIESDETKLSQILNNLIDNAIKFTSYGSIDLGCSIKGRDIEFYVKDTGIGIAPANHLIIFDRFRQAEVNIAQTYGGTGLGLAITKTYVTLLGGKIWISSNLGEGSTFFFNLPLETASKKHTVNRKSRIN